MHGASDRSSSTLLAPGQSQGLLGASSPLPPTPDAAMPPVAPNDTLNQTQRLILDGASRHPEHRLTRPEGVKAPTYRSALQALRRHGLIEDEAAADGASRPSGSVLSLAGLAFLGLNISEEAEVAPAEPTAAQAPRSGTKQALVVTMLTGPDGASIDEIMTATGWLPHTTRAALTGLRKRGFAIVTHRVAGTVTLYRLADEAGPATDDATTTIAEVA